VDEALRLAGELPDTSWWKANIVRDVARLQAGRGGDKEALAWIGKLSSPLLRGNAVSNSVGAASEGFRRCQPP
jgi:hypothetical protein